MTGRRTGHRCTSCGASADHLAPTCQDCGASAAWTRVPCGDCGARVDHAEPGACPECHAPVSPWDAVEELARAAGFHVPVAVSDAVPHPGAAGFERGRGKPAGQRADYRRPLPDGSEVHVRVYADHYEVHVDRRSAQRRVAHLARDAPLETAAGTTTLSLLVLAARRLRGRSGNATPGRLRELAARTVTSTVARTASSLPRPSVAARLRRRGSS